MRRRLLPLLLTVCLLPACYSFQAFQQDALPPAGSDVRIEIGPASDADVFRRNGSGEAGRERFRGEFLSWQRDTLSIYSVSPGIIAEYETIHIPGRFVRQAETMKLDGVKTGLTVLGAAAVAGIAVVKGFDASGGAPPGGGGGPDQGGFRIPIFQIIFPD